MFHLLPDSYRLTLKLSNTDVSSWMCIFVFNTIIITFIFEEKRIFKELMKKLGLNFLKIQVETEDSSSHLMTPYPPSYTKGPQIWLDQYQSKYMFLVLNSIILSPVKFNSVSYIFSGYQNDIHETLDCFLFIWMTLLFHLPWVEADISWSSVQVL